MKCWLRKFIVSSLFIVPVSGIAQVFNATQLSNCILNRNDKYQLFKENNFKKIYGGPRKAGGFLFLFQNKDKNEYIFSYANDSSEIQQFIYYLPTKSEYINFLKMKCDITDIAGQGRVLYNDGKKYYQINLSKK